MTIIFSAKRDRFALIAADRMHHCTDSDGRTTCRGGDKLVYHRTYPLVCAIAGLVDFHPQAAVQAVLDSIQSEQQLSGQMIADKLDAAIRPLVTGINYLKVWIALLSEGEPSVTWCQITTGQLDREPKGEDQWNCTDDLRNWYRQMPNLFTPLSDLSVNDWSVVCQNAIHAVSAGIHEEARRNCGENVECGLGIDLAILSCDFGLRRCQVPANQFPRAKYPES